VIGRSQASVRIPAPRTLWKKRFVIAVFVNVFKLVFSIARENFFVNSLSVIKTTKYNKQNAALLVHFVRFQLKNNAGKVDIP